MALLFYYIISSSVFQLLHCLCLFVPNLALQSDLKFRDTGKHPTDHPILLTSRRETFFFFSSSPFMFFINFLNCYTSLYYPMFFFLKLDIFYLHFFFFKCFLIFFYFILGIFLIRYFLYLHFKCYPLSWFFL